MSSGSTRTAPTKRATAYFICSCVELHGGPSDGAVGHHDECDWWHVFGWVVQYIRKWDDCGDFQ